MATENIPPLCSLQLRVRKVMKAKKEDSSGEVPVIVVKPFTEPNLTWLGIDYNFLSGQMNLMEISGGMNIMEMTNLIPPDSVYANLPRPSSLPPCPFSTSNHDAQVAAMKLWNGDFTVGFHDQGSDQQKAKFSLTAGPFDEENTNKKFHQVLIMVQVSRERHGSQWKSMLGYDTTRHNPEFSAALHLKHKKALADRVVHHFIRQHGYLLDKWAFEAAVDNLIINYNGNKKFLEAMLDVRMIKLDMLFNQTPIPIDPDVKAIIGLEMNSIGEVLEALERFELAGDLYGEAARDYLDGTEFEARVYMHAGLAYKRIKLYEKAEKDYVRALHHSCRTTKRSGFWDFNAEEPTSIITNFLVLYHEIMTLQLQRRTGNKDHVNVFVPTFTSLLYCAGFKANNGGLSHNMVIENAPKFVNFLRSECRTRTGSNRALMKALSTDTVHGFHEGLRAAMDSRNSIESFDFGIGDDKDEEKERNELVKEVQNVVLSEKPPRNLRACCSCFQLETEEKLHLNCPCKAVAYCSKNCQVSHWKEHKKFCSFQAAKKKKNKPKKKYEMVD